MRLSVIIPVLNIEKFLPKCLNSFLMCSDNEMEIEFICVAGKSRDDTLDVLRKYAKKDCRIQIVEQLNNGLSEARNLGVKKASGEFVLFADGDDLIIPELFEELLLRLRENPEIDVFVSDFRMFTEIKSVIREKAIFQITEENDQAKGMNFLPTMLKKRQCFWNVWRYVYRRSFLEKNKISFRNGSLSEDVDFTNQVLLANPNIIFLHCPFYCYRVARKDSLMGNTTSHRICDTVDILGSCIRTANQSTFEWKQYLIEQYQFELVLILAQLYEVPRDERKKIEIKLKENLKLLTVGDDGIAKAAFKICSMVGVAPVARILYLIKKLKHGRRSAWKVSKQMIQ